MDRQQLKQQIIDYSQSIGINKIGFASADPFTHLEASLYEQKEKGYTTGFEHPNIDERVYPNKIFSQPKTIISIALAYPSTIKDKAEKVKGERRGQFARASWGVDYHVLLKEKLDKLIQFIQSTTTTATFKPMVDTGELIDVAVAQRAGIGFVGKNGLLITKEFGSYVYLGEIITDLEFPYDKPMENGCGDCTRCIDFCPTKALLGDGRMNAKKCLSYQTQTKGYMPEQFRKKMGHVIYGCDICQFVCPYNKGVDSHYHEAMEPDANVVTPLLKPLLTMSNKEFKQVYGHLSGAWRGKKPIQRNAIIALANYKDKTAIPNLLALMETDTRPVIRGTAAWAVSVIVKEGTHDLIEFFEDVLKTEEDLETQQEIEKALVIIKEKCRSKR